MSIIFRDIEVYVNNTGLLAESVTVNQSTPLSDAMAIGFFGSYNQPINGNYQASFDISYIMDCSREVNYELTRMLMRYAEHGKSGINPATIVAGGLTGFGYLQNWSFDMEPNSLIRAKATYVIFSGITGYIKEKGSDAIFMESGFTGLAHGWTTYIPNKTNKLDFQAYALSYFWNGEYQPSYLLGQLYPTQVFLHGGNETMSFTSSYYSGILVSGARIQDHLKLSDNLFTIEALSSLTGVSLTNNLTFNMANDTIVNEYSTTMQLNDIVKTQITARRYF